MSFVDAHDFSVGLVPRVLGIPASTYYDWRARRTAPSQRRREDEELLRLIDAIRGEHEFAATYGSPRVWLELRRGGVRVGRKRVERIMRVHGRQGAYLRRGWKHGSTRQNPRHTAPPDLLGRDFTATAPNTNGRHHSLIQYRLCRRPHAYPHRRRRAVAGRRARCVLQQGGRLGQRPTSDHRAGRLGARLRDLVAGCARRAAGPPQRQGLPAQYTSIRFTQRLLDAGIAPSTGGVGDSFDKRPRGEPVVGHQDRADLLARNHFRDESRGAGGAVPLHRRMVQPAAHSSRTRWAFARRIRGSLAGQTASTPLGYPATGDRRSQIDKSPEKRGNSNVIIDHRARRSSQLRLPHP
jgi:putative transposase